MPRRFVYTPKAYVYTRSTYGTKTGVTYDLTRWVTAGRVDRKVNQVSSAEITLRNPYKRFTRPSEGVAFHPMDPITIYLERLPGYPVRVFTGYLDDTPYLQLYPGTITLKASCTLKKLLYTYFDPSLPFVISFLGRYGWQPTGAGGLINYSVFGGNQPKPGTQQQDSSIGRLLWASLFEMGQWTDSNIYIENLPPGITQRVATLMNNMSTAEQTAVDEFTAFMKSIIGSGAQGSGGGTGGTFSGGPLSSPNGLTIGGSPMTTAQMQWANLVLSVSKQEGASDTATGVILTEAIAESKMGVAMGWDAQNPTYGGLLAGSTSNFSSLGAADSTAVSQAEIIAALHGNKGYQLPGGALAYTGTNLLQAAMTNSGSGTQFLSQTGVNSYASEAQAIIQAAKQSPGGLANQVASTIGKTGSTTATQSGSTAPASTQSPSSGSVINPIPGFTITAHDAGIDGTAPVGSGILAPADSTLVGTIPGWYSNQPLLEFHFDQNLPGAMSQYWYVAEQINPVSMTNGTKFKQGQAVAHFAATGTGIEIGWGDPNGSVNGSGTLTGSLGLGDLGHQASKYSDSFVTFFGIGGGTPTGTIGGANPGGTGTGTTATVDNTAQAFVAEINFPTVADMSTAIMLGAEHKGLMHDQSLMPWIQQLSQASLRSFQSLPDGSFYGFYPDYFGEFGHHNAYWMIDDIELLDGGVNLTDNALATHVFAVGDNLWNPSGGVPELYNQLFSSGAINVFNAFGVQGIINHNQSQPGSNSGLGSIMNAEEAIQFIKRYGARPIVQNYPMVRSGIFEMLLAYQQFMYAWSNQFRTPFRFTFMPEIFPGGKIGFPNHGLKMYVNSVTHSWDYQEGGFTTDAELSAPSLLNPNEDPAKYGLPPNMVEALIEPIRQPGAPTLTPTQEKQLKQQTQQGVTSIDQQAQNVAQYITTF